MRALYSGWKRPARPSSLPFSVTTRMDDLLRAIFESGQIGAFVALFFAGALVSWGVSKAWYDRKDRLAPERVADLIEAHQRITRHETEVAIKGYALDQLTELSTQIVYLQANNAESEELKVRIAELEAQAGSLQRLATLVPVDVAEAIRARISAKRAERLSHQSDKPLILVAPGDQTTKASEIESAAVAFIGEAARGSIWKIDYDPRYRGGSTYVRVKGKQEWMRYHREVLRHKGWLAVPVFEGPEHMAGIAIGTWARAFAKHRPDSHAYLENPPFDAQNISFTDRAGETHLLGILATATGDGVAPMTQYFVGPERDVLRKYIAWVSENRVSITLPDPETLGGSHRPVA